MPRNAEGFLDPIPEAASDPAPAPEPAAEGTVGAATAGAVELPEGQSVQVKTEKKDPANSPARPEGYVPRQALEEERRARQEERAARERAETNFQRFLDRWHAENQPQQEQPQGPPDLDTNPMEFIGYTAQQVAEIKQQLAQIAQGGQQQTQVAQLFDYSNHDVADYAKSRPEMQSALQFLHDHGVQYYAGQGVHPAMMKQALDRWQVDMAAKAHAAGIRPALYMRAMAEQLGWQAQGKTEAVPAATVDVAAESMQREMPKRDPDTGQFVSAEAKAARIKESQERNGSLTSAPGAPVEKMTAKELAKMSESDMWREFDKMSRRKGGKEWDASMGFR